MCTNIHTLLNNEERKKLGDDKGRFRDIDTCEIHRYCEDKSEELIENIGIVNEDILRFESETAPNVSDRDSLSSKRKRNCTSLSRQTLRL